MPPGLGIAALAAISGPAQQGASGAPLLACGGACRVILPARRTPAPRACPGLLLSLLLPLLLAPVPLLLPPQSLPSMLLLLLRCLPEHHYARLSSPTPAAAASARTRGRRCRWACAALPTAVLRASVCAAITLAQKANHLRSLSLGPLLLLPLLLRLLLEQRALLPLLPLLLRRPLHACLAGRPLLLLLLAGRACPVRGCWLKVVVAV